jgi:Two component regulator propeller
MLPENPVYATHRSEAVAHPVKWVFWVAALQSSQGLTSDVVWKLLVDRENVLWVGTNSGSDQLRRNGISQLSIPLTSEHQLAVADAGAGCVWTGSRSRHAQHSMRLQRTQVSRLEERTVDLLPLAACACRSPP